MNLKIAQAWICPLCGYVHYGPEPPEECPTCGTPQHEFIPYDEPEPVQPDHTARELNLAVVVGAGIAGVSATEAIRKAAPEAEVILLSNEPYLPYIRMNLTRLLAGEVSANHMAQHPESWYDENNINLQCGAELIDIDLDRKVVTLQGDSRLPFDKLILAHGSHAFVPPIPGVDLKNVTTLRTFLDAGAILEACQENQQWVCIGGGLLGLETAGALAKWGLDVTVLENQDWLLPRQLNQNASRLFQAMIRQKGIGVRTGARTRELVGDAQVREVILQDGTRLAAEMVVISAGVRPNIELALGARLAVNKGILVNDTLQTSHPDVYAAGDVAEHRGILYGTWAPAQAQGSAAGWNAAGQQVEFAALPPSNTLKVLGIDLFSIGQTAPKDAADLVIEGDYEGKYACFVFRENHMVGSILLGDASLAARTRKVIEEGVDCSGLLQKKPELVAVQQYLENGS